ncbi:MAG: polymerase sigma-H factor [Frankiales bacterium]|nr:polymerase sigma-H factor [Frankiales bacterium]
MRLLRERPAPAPSGEPAAVDLRLVTDAGPQPAAGPQATAGLQADEVGALVDLVEIADPEALLAAEIEAEVQAELARDAAVGALDAEIAAAESLVVDLAGELRDSADGRVRTPDSRADDALVLRARGGDDAALSELLQKYRAFARVKARSYFLVGADREDIVQEGMIGLYKAVRDFNPELQTSFRSFAELCVTRQIITAIKTATRQKHGPLNNYVSFSRPETEDDSGERTLADVLPTSDVSDPCDLVISAERVRALQAHFDAVLSDLETEVLRLYVEGKSYQEIAERLQRHVKSIDNALQRIKKKLEGHLQARSVADAG